MAPNILKAKIAVDSISQILQGSCSGINCDDIPFNGGCLDCKIVRVKQVIKEYEED